MRMISPDEAKKIARDFLVNPYDAISTCTVIDKTPTIDAVPVVRCRECKYWLGEHVCDLDCNHETHTGPDDFCSRGQRKEDEHEQ